MHRRHRLLLSCLLILLPARPLVAQQGGTPAFFESVDVEVVNLEVFVSDRQGRPVTGLGRGDFQLFVDGREVPIGNFYAEVGDRPAVAPGGDGPPAGAGSPAEDAATPIEAAPPPAPVAQQLHLAVLVDNLHLRPTHRRRAFASLRRLLDQRLAPGDLVTVATMERSLHLRSDFSSDREVIARVLDEIETTTARDFSVEDEQRFVTEEENLQNSDRQDRVINQASIDWGNRVVDEARYANARASLDGLRTLLRTLAGIPGRKALLHLSDGLASAPGSFDLLQEFRDLGRIANAHGITLYAVDAVADHGARGRSADLPGSQAGMVATAELEREDNSVREAMELACATTGGRRLQMSTRLDQELAELAGDFATFYSLGFQSPDGADPKSHAVEVKVRGKGLRLRYRDSYVPKPRDVRTADAVASALLYGTADNPGGVRAEPGAPRPGKDGAAVLPVVLEIPLRGLVLQPDGDFHRGRLSLFFAVQDAAGDPRPVRKEVFQLNVPADRLQEALGRSAAYTLSLPVMVGDRRAAVAVRDEIGGGTSLVRVELALPDPLDGG
jgi:VWFA-related protein